MKHKLTALLCAGLLLTLPGCGGGSSETPYTEDNMPYGATMTMDTTRAIGMQYDRRFMEPGLADVICSYYQAIENNDAAAFEQIIFPLYLDYIIRDYGQDQITAASLVENTCAAYTESYGSAFRFSMLDITDLEGADNVSQNRDSYLNMLHELAEEAKAAGKDAPDMDSVSAFYEMSVDRYLDDKGTTGKDFTKTALRGESLFGIHYQGKWYLVFS